MVTKIMKGGQNNESSVVRYAILGKKYTRKCFVNGSESLPRFKQSTFTSVIRSFNFFRVETNRSNVFSQMLFKDCSN